MIKKLTEKEFIDIYSEQEYKRFAFETYKAMINSESYKSKDKIIYFMGVSKLSEKNNLHFEATLKRNKVNGIDVLDFGFINLVITDEIDYSLDRYNLIKNKLTNINKND